jgi:hypothetical protein
MFTSQFDAVHTYVRLPPEEEWPAATVYVKPTSVDVVMAAL